MTSIQERLQLKRVPLDTWNVREQLCLASAVAKSGDQNWMSVARVLKTLGDPNRPADWYSQKSCAAQYGVLLENVETPKRKKRNSEGAGETPQESIIKRLTQDRIAEIQKSVADLNQQYSSIRSEISEIKNPLTSEEKLKEMWNSVETAKKTREKEMAKRATWLREREERKARAEKNGRQNTPPTPTTQSTPSSPLLTSLLKSTPVVTTPQHISHPANSVDSISPSANAPTLSLLLEKPTPSIQDNKNAAIEHIKNQLVQIEQQLKANPSPPVPIQPVTPLDIDDIEIKAEDVYAFRDVDIDITPVSNIHKPVRPQEKTPNENKEETKEKEEMEKFTLLDDTKNNDNDLPITNENNTEKETIEEPAQAQPEVTPPEPEVKISFPEVKFPTIEIKVLQPEEQMREEKREASVPKEVVEDVKEMEKEVKEIKTVPEKEIEPKENVETPTKEIEETPDVAETPETSKNDEIAQEEDTPTSNVDSTNDKVPETEIAVTETITEDSQDESKIEKEDKEEKKEVVTKEEKKEVKKDDDLEEPPAKRLKEDVQQEVESEVAGVKETEDTHTETDDDTPMELVREEEKDGKKKRDYSRKKKSDSRTCSGSESAAETSAPDSPLVSDAERQHRMWKKSVMLVYSRLAAHKYASLFLRPISDSEAPGYSVVVKKPMDLSTIKKNIDNGIIRTTAEFQRDVLLMLTNALMYNSSEHRVYQMAKDMFHEAENQLGMLLAAQAHAGLGAPPVRRKRRHE